jgi:hypothetical protein
MQLWALPLAAIMSSGRPLPLNSTSFNKGYVVINSNAIYLTPAIGL